MSPPSLGSQFEVASLRQLVDVAVGSPEVNPCHIILVLPTDRTRDDGDTRSAKLLRGCVNIIDEEPWDGSGREVRIVGVRTEDLHLRAVWQLEDPEVLLTVMEGDAQKPRRTGSPSPSTSPFSCRANRSFEDACPPPQARITRVAPPAPEAASVLGRASRSWRASRTCWILAV